MYAALVTDLASPVPARRSLCTGPPPLLFEPAGQTELGPNQGPQYSPHGMGSAATHTPPRAGLFTCLCVSHQVAWWFRDPWDQRPPPGREENYRPRQPGSPFLLWSGRLSRRWPWSRACRRVRAQRWAPGHGGELYFRGRREAVEQGQV